MYEMGYARTDIATDKPQTNTQAHHTHAKRNVRDRMVTPRIRDSNSLDWRVNKSEGQFRLEK